MLLQIIPKKIYNYITSAEYINLPPDSKSKVDKWLEVNILNYNYRKPKRKTRPAITEATRMKLRESKLEYKNPMYGKEVSEETKQKLREKKLGKTRKPFSEETKNKMRLSALNRRIKK